MSFLDDNPEIQDCMFSLYADQKTLIYYGVIQNLLILAVYLWLNIAKRGICTLHFCSSKLDLKNTEIQMP